MLLVTTFFTFPILSGIFTILLLLTCSALISASEVAFFSLDPTEKELLKNESEKVNENAFNLLNNPKDLLATILIANNFVNVGVVILSTYLLNEIYPPVAGNETIRFLLEAVLITTIILLAGEVMPKVYATKNSITIIRLMAQPLNIIGSIPPFSWLKNFLTNGTNLIHRYAKHKNIKVSSNELEQILALTKENNTPEEEHKILEGIVKFGNTDVKQIMKARMDIVAFEHNLNYHELLFKIIEAGFSRVPIYDSTIDNIIGVLYIKDLIPYLNEKDEFDWKNLIRKPFFVPENKKLDDLLKEFQVKKIHMAIVVDEYGGAGGIVTLEDVLEEIVGDITDEFDEKEVIFTKISENEFVFEGRTSLVDFYKVINIDGKEFEAHKGDMDTIGGFLVNKAGKILRNKEFIEFEDFKLIVETSDKKRIKTIRVINQNPIISNEE